MKVLAICVLLALVSAASAQVGYCKLVGGSNDPGVTGDIWFYPATDGSNNVQVSVNINGITQNPDSTHGIHVHTWGDISTPTGTAAGPHYLGANTSVLHGCPDNGNDGREEGDMGNWQATGGVINQMKTLDLLALTGDTSIIGRSVVLHNTTDNCMVSTSAGSRNAQCVIGIANPAYTPSSVSSATSNPALAGTSSTTVGICKLQGIGSANSGISGTIRFAQVGDKVVVNASITGITGAHGIHVHTYGDLHNDTTGDSAGTHFDPLGTASHALPTTKDSSTHHAGDLGNICSYDSSSTAYYYYSSDAALDLNSANTLIGRGLVLHGIRDDGSTNYGPRVAWCVIGVANSTAAAANPLVISVDTTAEPVCATSSTSDGAIVNVCLMAMLAAMASLLLLLL